MSSVKKGYTRPLDLKHGRVDMSHGGGGRAMVQLITDLFAKLLGNEYLAQGNDGTWLPAGNGRLVVSTDSHVVSPLFFPGGDIGGLSVHGTVNDVAVMGATPLYLTAGFILEEGFPLADLARIVDRRLELRRDPIVPVDDRVKRGDLVGERGRRRQCRRCRGGGGERILALRLDARDEGVERALGRGPRRRHPHDRRGQLRGECLVEARRVGQRQRAVLCLV